MCQVLENPKYAGASLFTARRLAVDAGADRQRDGAALVTEPWRDHGTEAAGGAPGRNDQELIGRVQGRVFRIAAIVHHRRNERR